ncbi:MAG: YihY/virulence factor BrkB family protein [Eubacteriales bacterium]|nr:YihY/virulence factor BrkB family protein [Eubacteriales bacterium]
MKKGRDLVQIIQRTIDVFSKHEMAVYSGYATFYFMMSLVPLLMMVISLINILPWFSVDDVSDFLYTMMPDIPQIRSALVGIIVNLNRQSGQWIAYLFAMTSLWSGSHGVFAMMAGLEKINHTQEVVFKERPKAILYTIIFTLLIPSMLFFQVLRSSIQNAITYIFDFLALPDLGRHINRILQLSGIVTLAITILVIVLTYTFLPAGRRKMRNQLPGSIFTSFLWVFFTNAFSFFIRRFWRYSSVYGTLAAVFLAAMWLKFIITILFYGASLNRALQVKVSMDLQT